MHLCEAQLEFHRKRSYTLLAMGRWADAMANNHLTDVIFLDFIEAFKNAPHDRLLLNLSTCELQCIPSLSFRFPKRTNLLESCTTPIKSVGCCWWRSSGFCCGATSIFWFTTRTCYPHCNRLASFTLMT